MIRLRVSFLITFVVAVTVLLILAAPTLVAAQSPQDYPPITDYYSPCKFGTHAEAFTWHGINQDGLPPVDLDRRSTDFLCADKEVYAPYSGVVYGTTGRYGGLILIDDADHDVCIVFLGMLTFEVGQGDVVQQSQLLGVYNWHVHIAATDGTCEAANWYDRAARDLERPIEWVEFGTLLPSDIYERDAVPLVSQNPTGE